MEHGLTGRARTGLIGAATSLLKRVRDATYYRITPERLRESEERLRLLIEGVTDYAIFSINLDGTILFWNSGAEHVFGYSEAEVVGKHFSLMYTADAIAAGVPDTEIARAAKDGVALDEAWHVRRGGDLFYASGEMTRLKADADGNPRGFVKIAHDVTTRIEAFETVKRQALYDDLTQLPNRASFFELLERYIVRAKQEGDDRFAVILVDLDHFESINVSLGHVMADGLLVQVARLLERCVRTNDIVARLDTDRFAILLREVVEPEDAMRIVERIEETLEHSIYLDGFEIHTTASMGIAIGSSARDSAEDALRDADIAMYEAKARGRACHVVFDREMQDRAALRLNLQMDLRRAVARLEFFNEYQPIVSLERSMLVGFEALVRWNHPERGVVLPGEFIPEAESIGLIVQIDRWVLHEACRQLRACQVQCGDDALTVSVNLSIKQFAHKNLLDDIREALEQNHLAAQSLKLEITETVFMEDFETISGTAALLRELGVELYIDDFGTGYSSLSRLTRLPLKVLKVDRIFVNQISGDPRGVEIARTIVTLAHNLGLVALAEGIETEVQLTTLVALGCEFGQGYWFSRPVGADVAETLIGHRLPLLVVQ